MKNKKKVIIICSILIIFIIFSFWQNNYLQVSNYTYSSDKIGDDLKGLKIVQISDLHNKRFGNNQKRIIEKIEECEPDLIVVTGDVIDSGNTDINAAIDFFEGAIKIAPVYYVTGNHEYLVSSDVLDELISEMEDLGVKYLNNECIEIKIGEETINLIGINDTSLGGEVFDKVSELAVRNIDKGNLSVLLAHEPQFIEDYCKKDMDVVLSGHAHGGQVRLPFVGGIVAPGQGIFPKYTEGKYVMKETTMFVSRGLGNSIIPLRIFNFPEIVCIELN